MMSFIANAAVLSSFHTHCSVCLHPLNKSLNLAAIKISNIFITDYCSTGSLARSTSSWLRKGLFKSRDCITTGTFFTQSTCKLHKLLGVRSRSELGGFAFTSRCSLWRHVWWVGNAAWTQESAGRDLIAIFHLVGDNGLCEVS